MKQTYFAFNIDENLKNKFTKINQQYLINDINNKNIDSLFWINNTKITIYKTNKCLIQGNNAEEIFNKYFANYSSILQITELSNNIINYDNYKTIGSDEVGVGDYFGGLIICSVYIYDKHLETVKSLKVQDSKKISDVNIKKIANEIKKYVKYKFAILNNRQYNAAIMQYKNSHILKTLLHYKAITDVINELKHENISYDYALIDEYASKSKFIDYLTLANVKYDTNLKLNFLPKAETYSLAVACASILARDKFLSSISSLEEQLNYKIPLGAWNEKIKSTIFELVTINSIKTKNQFLNYFNAFLKLHFKNTITIFEELELE